MNIRKVDKIRTVLMLNEGQTELSKQAWVKVLFLAIMTTGLFLAARNAADGYMYFQWAEYFMQFDVAIFSGFPKSVTGVPLVHWSYGSGLLAAIPAVMSTSSNAISIYSIAAFLGVANTALLAYVAYLRTRSLTIMTLVLAVVMLFTPAGFYFNKYTSESWTILLTLSGLSVIEWDKKYNVQASRYVGLVLAVIMYFLFLVKSQNLVLCLGLWLIFIGSNFSMPIFSKDNLKYILAKSSIMLVVGGIGLLFLLIFNHIVNGNIFKTPYNVGDMEFSTFSLHNLKIAEVLFSSWHGLLTYHPFLGLAIILLFRELIQEPTRTSFKQYLIIGGCLLVFVLTIMIQSAWVIWWMGTGTFGARGFCGAAILLIYALMHCKSLENYRLTTSAYIIVCILGVYSAYVVSLEETNIVNYEHFLATVKSKSSVMIFWVIICTTILLQFIKTRLKLSNAEHLVYLLLALALVPVMNSTFRDVFTFENIIGSSWQIGSVFLMTLAIILLAKSSFWHSMRRVSIFIRPAVFTFVVAVFFVSILLQIGLLRNFHAEAKISTVVGKSLDCNEYVSSYNEYQMIEGHEREKRALYEFLVRQGCIN
jgi:hypothetical protein